MGALTRVGSIQTGAIFNVFLFECSFFVHLWETLVDLVFLQFGHVTVTEAIFICFFLAIHIKSYKLISTFNMRLFLPEYLSSKVIQGFNFSLEFTLCLPCTFRGVKSCLLMN